MSKITVAEALKLVPVKKTALYSDIKKGILSAETDSRGRKVVDPAELERVYGHLKIPNPNGTPDGTKRTTADNNGRVNGKEQTDTNNNGKADETPARLIYSRLKSIF